MIIKKGDSGPRVKECQKALGITADGEFGPGTEAAVKQFQESKGLTADGIIGPKTYELLIGDADTDRTNVVWDKANDTDNKVEMLGKYTSEAGVEIDRAYLDSDEYVRDYGKIKPLSFFIHHTAGWENPYNTIKSWNVDTRGRVATQYVIGGKNIKTGDTSNDGVIVECFPDGYIGWHTGKTGNFEKVSKKSIGVEICNFGYAVKKGNKFYNYVNVEIPKDQIVDLGYSFRGHQYWHAYTPAQIDALAKLFKHIKNVYPTIDLLGGLPALLKSGMSPKDAFEFNSDAFNGKVVGTWTHTNIRKDKFDCFPQPELVELLKSL